MIWEERVKFHSNDTLDGCENAINAMQSEHQNIHTHTQPQPQPNAQYSVGAELKR